jgi:glycosyltransferase involved in cell wall biosynthesis
MRIALVVHDFDRAIGHGRYCYEISKRLAPQHHIDVWANRFAAPAQSNLAFRQVPAWRKSAMLTVLTFLWASEKRLRRERYDLIHAQGLTCWNADVITAHVCNAARLKQTPLEGRHRVFAMIAGALERKFYHQRQARHLIAISKRVADEITAHYAWRGSVSVIYHGIDTTQFRPVEDSSEKAAQRKSLPLSKADWVWLFVGEAIKGLDKVIEQLPRFPDAKLLVISRSHLDTFRQRALKLGVADRIQFCGPSNVPRFTRQRMCLSTPPIMMPSAWWLQRLWRPGCR